MVKLATFDSNWELMCRTDPFTITPDNSERRIKNARHFAGSGSADQSRPDTDSPSHEGLTDFQPWSGKLQ